MSDKLTQTFLAEANELIIEIERGLLDIGRGSNDSDDISAIFRSMHTLKGASGMFGFELVQRLTHHLENIYQDIRDGKRLMNSDITDLTFKTLDQLRILLNADAGDSEPDGYAVLLETVKAIGSENKTMQQIGQSTENASEKTYYVRFAPHANIVKNGNNPLYLVDDLVALGSAIVLPFFNQLPDLNRLDVESCYMAFEVVICTDKTEDEIGTVFLFVEGNCELQIVKLTNENSIKEWTNDKHPFVNRDLNTAFGVGFIKNTFDKRSVKRSGESGKTGTVKNTNIRVGSDQLDELMNLVSELVTTQARLSLFATGTLSAELAGISENIEKITRRLRDNAFTMSLVPLDSIRVRFQRLATDLAKELNKSVDFVTEGMETKIDKSIIEKLIDPILHILRNCIDHGIEISGVRTKNGKAANGMLSLKAFYSGSNVVIEICDDGAGLNLQRIKDKAISRGLIDRDAQLTERELTDLIFLPGFSTATNVTDVSGRGVGMDVVRRNIADMRGEVEVTTAEGKGTCFTIRLPLTLSILDGLLVRIGKTDFILPLSSVVKCHEVSTSQLECSFNNWMTLDGNRTPFIYLREIFSITDAKPYYSQLINVPYAGKTVGLVVDHIIGECQAVLKPLGGFYSTQDEFSGATILGDGSVALVMDPVRLISKVSSK